MEYLFVLTRHTHGAAANLGEHGTMLGVLTSTHEFLHVEPPKSTGSIHPLTEKSTDSLGRYGVLVP